MDILKCIILYFFITKSLVVGLVVVVEVGSTVSSDSYHVRVTIEWVAIEKGVVDSVFGENGQSAADDAAAKKTPKRQNQEWVSGIAGAAPPLSNAVLMELTFVEPQSRLERWNLWFNKVFHM